MELKIECTNGYTTENLRIEGNKILIECYPKETEDRIFAPTMAEVIAKQFEKSTGLEVKYEDLCLLKDLLGLWSETFDERLKDD